MKEVSPDKLTHLAGPALRAFFRIAERWSMDQNEQMAALGIASPELLQSWQEGRATDFSQDTLQRISLTLGIFKAINILIPVPKLADRWIRAANDHPLFEGRSAMSNIATGKLEELIAVRRYLDAELYS
ncbi:MAG: antitoxin Xre-like helix-turn-helix domain-containing protein [Sphingomonadaceae bacterium]